MNSTSAPGQRLPNAEQLAAPRFSRGPWPWVILGALWLVIYFAGIFSPALLDDADSIHAEAAREMVLRHDWVTLYINGVRYLEKAPLMYWGVAASYSLFGVSDWSSRLSLMLGVLATLLVTWRLGRYAYGEPAGLYSGVVLATSVGVYIFTRFLIPDILVGLWLAATFFFFLISLEEGAPSRWTCWGLAAACALNALTKGLIGLVFPAAVIGLYLILTGNLRHLLKLRPGSSLIVFLAVGAPWHVLAALRNPDQGTVRGFLWFYFVNEHWLRYLNKRVPRDYDTVPLVLFWVLLMVWVVPWVTFLPAALKKVPVRWRKLRSRLDRSQRATLLFALWALVIVVFFSFSTRQEYYTIPAVPGLALLVGGWLQVESESSAGSAERRAGRLASAVLFIVGIAIFAAGVFFLSVSKTPAPGTDLADLLKRNPQDYALSFGHFLDLTPQSLGAFRLPLLGFSLAFLLGTGANWLFRRQGRPAGGNTALALMMVVVLASVHAAYVTFNPILSSKTLALAIEQRYRPGDLVVVGGEYTAASSLNIYTGQHLLVLHEPSSNLWYGSRFPDAPHIWETQASFDTLWAGSARVFLWADQGNPAYLQGAPRYLVARSGGKFIFCNRPLEN